MKQTPLYEAHRALGARMVDFAGWAMPVQYRGILEEHHAVRRRAGLFDVSHMGEIEVRGPGALAACQRVTVNDVSRLRDGRAQYSVLCLPDGGVIDDVIIYRLAEDRYLFCVNASNRAADYQWLRENRQGADVVDCSDEYAQIALQGPQASNVLRRLTDLPLEGVAPFSFVRGRVAGREALVARTGYTGEDGWELYGAPDAARALWDALLTAGEPVGLQPAGLGARDTLRLEAALPLYGHELTRETTPLEARLGWVVRLEKGDFIGRTALLEQKRSGLRRQLIGLTLLEPGVPRGSYPVRCAEEVVGVVTSGTKSPTLGKAVALAYVTPVCADVGTRLAVEIRGRPIVAEVVDLPFYRRPA